MNLCVACSQLVWDLSELKFDSWLMILEPGGFNVCHHHSSNFFSGAAFLNEFDEISGRLVLKDARLCRRFFHGI